MSHPISAVIVGAGYRALKYASYAEARPDELKIVAVAEPSETRRRETAARFGIPESACFESAEALAAVPRLADFAINGTMDPQHVPTSLPLLAAGYDLLLEKPFATNETEMELMLKTARHQRRKVAVCHVLRFSPFYSEIAKRVAAGVIGELIHLQTSEHVAYDHMAVNYVRGKYANEAETGSGMLLAKCSHDLDLIAWLKNDAAPVSVSSFGSRSFFRPEKAPKGAGNQCLVDCPADVENRCLYSARKHYLANPNRWGFIVLDGLEGGSDAPLSEKEAFLKNPDNPYGRCVFHHDNTVVDRQTLAIEFADGCTAAHSMVGGAPTIARHISLTGTKGEIIGQFEKNRFIVRLIEPTREGTFREETVDFSDPETENDPRETREFALVADFLRHVRGEPPSFATPLLENSVYSHLLCFLADRARTEKRVVSVPPFS